MKQILTVLSFTFKDAIHKKAFIISTIVMLAVVTVIALLPSIISYFDRGSERTPNEISEAAADGSRSKTCIYIDNTGLFESSKEALLSKFTDTDFTVGDINLLDDYRAEITEDGNKCVFYVTEEDGRPVLNAIFKDESSVSSFSPYDITNEVNKVYIDTGLIKLGMSAEAIEFAHTNLPVNLETISELNTPFNMSGYLIGLFLTLLMFLSIYLYGYGVATSIATEKSSRVMETLVVSAKPSKILIGKCAAMGLVGLFQLLLVICYALFCYKAFAPSGAGAFGIEISLSAFSIPTILLTVLYFIMGFTLYAMVYSVCGSSVSRIEDLQQAVMPVTILTILSYYLVIFTDSLSATGSMAVLPIYFPFSSPFIVPTKIINSNITTVQLLTSIAILAATITVITYISVKIYSSSVLHYGKKLKIKDMFKESMKQKG